MGKRVLVVGGVAGGASAAARVRRLDAEASITVFERGEHVSFSNCSLPYFLSRTVGDAESLVLMTPEGFKASYDIDVRINNEVCAIDRAAKKIRVRMSLPARSTRRPTTSWCSHPDPAPSGPGPSKACFSPHVFTVRNVNDIVKLDKYAGQEGRSDVVVIGGGFIGLEVAENLREGWKARVRGGGQQTR